MNNLSVYEFDEVLIMQYFYTYNYYNSLKSSDIVKMIKDMELSASKFKQIKGVLYSAFKYARSHNIVEVDPVPPAMRILNSSFKQSYDPEKNRSVFTSAAVSLT